MTDIIKKSIEIPQNFLIIKDLQNEAFLGSTFLRSDYVYMTTRNELVITLDPTSQFPINKLTNSKKFLIVPLNEHKPKTTQDSGTTHSKKDKIYDVVPLQQNQYLTQAKIIKRFKLTLNYNINLHPDMVRKIELTKPKTITTCFMIMNLKDKPFRIIETLYSPEDHTCIMIIMNDTLDVIQIFEGDEIAVLEQLDCKNKEEIQRIHMTLGEGKGSVTYNMTATTMEDDTTEKLDQDTGGENGDKELMKIIRAYDTDDKHKEILLQQAKKTGMVDVPISTFIENNTRMDAYELKEFEETFTDVPSMLKFVKMDHLSDKSQQDLIQCFKDNFDAFGRFVWNVRGYVKHTIANIEVTSTQTLHQKFIPIPKPLEGQVTEILNKLQEQGIIRRATSEDPLTFLHNLHVIRKSDSRIRLLIDNRISNAFIQPINYNYMTSNEFLHSIPHKVKALTILDLSNSFYSIRIRREDQHILSFLDSRRNRYCYCRLGQGVKTAPALLQTAISRSLQGFSNIACFMDDIAIYSLKDQDDCIKTVIEVITALRKSGWTLNVKKMQLARSTIMALGYNISLNRLSIPKLKLNGFLEWVRPKHIRN